MAEFTNEELRRIDDIFGQAANLCWLMTDGECKGADMGIVGPIVANAVDILVERGYKVRFPWRDDGGNTHDTLGEKQA